MKSIFVTFLAVIVLDIAQAQTKATSIIKKYGEIYALPNATVLPDPNQAYNIVIDMYTGMDDSTQVTWSYYNVARLINLHGVAGVSAEKIQVVLAIHGKAIFALLNNKEYKKRYGIDNPNLDLLDALHEAGVRITVCGQSMVARQLEEKDIYRKTEIAISMLTTVTHYQMKGYAYFKF